MAEPARQPNPVYDEDSEQPVTKPDLRAREGLSTNPTSGKSGGATSGTSSQSGGASSSTSSSADGASSSTPSRGGGFYNQTGDTPASLKSAEESPDDADDDRVGKGYTPSNSSQTRRGRVRFRLTRRKAVFGIGGTAIIAGIFGFTSISSGPLQLIHLSEILQKNFSGSNEVSKLRLRNMYRFYKSGGSIGETRVSALGSKVVGRTLSQLSDVGIDFQRDSLDHIKSATIDTGKLTKSYPELEGMSATERQSFLAETFGLPEDQLVKVGSGSNVNGTKFAVNTRDFGIEATRALTKNSLAALDNGNVVTGIKFREMAKFFKLPSLFHPIDRAGASAETKLTTKVERVKAEEERQKALEKPTTDTITAESDLKGKLNGQNIAASALLLTAGMCLVRSVADDVVAVNRGAIVVPAALQATDKIAVGSQVQSGQDISATQAGAVADSFSDNSGKTIWQGQALQALSGANQSGQDLPYDYKQAFSNDTTAQHIKDAIGSPTVAGVDVGAVACSTPGLIIQGLVGIALAAGSIIAAIPSGGASIAAEIAKAGAGAAATAGAIYLIQQQGVNLLSDKAVIPSVFSGPLGGNLLAYGGRESGNIGARASGGVPLSNTNAALLDKQQQLESQQGFQSESFFARTFDARDYRSLTGRLADSLSPSLTHNFASATSSLSNIGTLIPHVFSSLFAPKIHADNQPYDWGFAQDGIPSEILNDPSLQDPYANADAVAKLLDGSNGQNYVDKAKACFGSDVSKGSDGWNATPAEAVNPNNDSYVNAHCGDISDYNWRRMILFVSDTGTMEAAACYQGDDQSCSDLGYDQPGSGGTATTPSTGDISAYKNPLRDVMKNGSLFPRRIDEGVDYGGHGPVYAMGNGVVSFAGTGEWFAKYGQSVVYKLSDGPAKGMSVYFSESCTPTVKAGDTVTPDTVICNMHGDNDPWIETGWAVGGAANQDMPSAHIGYNECATVYGVNYSDLLKKLGAPPGNVECGGPDETLPVGWPTW